MPCSTSRANLSDFNSLRVILDTKTSGCNGSSILARRRGRANGLLRRESLTVLGSRRTRKRIPRGKPWDRQPISGKLRRKFGVSPGFAAYRHPTPLSRYTPPGFVGVVGAQGLQFAPQGCLAKRIEQVLDRGEIQVLAADHQVVALAGERDEIQAEGTRGGRGSDTTIGQARVNAPCRGQMAGRRGIAVSGHRPRRDAGCLQARIKQLPAARTLFPIGQPDAAASQVLHRADPLGIPAANRQTLLPDGKGEHCGLVLRKLRGARRSTRGSACNAACEV